MTMETPWTEGSWTVEVDEGTIIIVDTDGDIVAYLEPEPDLERSAEESAKVKAKWREQEANARLIAAAPEMAELLERCRPYFNRDPEPIDWVKRDLVVDIDALLTRLRGEPETHHDE